MVIRIGDILDTVQGYNPEARLDVIARAYVYSAQVHEGQVRLSGESYLSHPLEIAGILAGMKMDVDTIAAGLLHDTIEDTHTTREAIENMFGPGIAHIVSGVTKISKLTLSDKTVRQAESLRKMILAMADDIRVILIKLADRLHNMRTLGYHVPEKQKLIARETLDIYSPIAARLGIFWLKQELEDISFFYTNQEEYQAIDNLVNRARDEKEAYVREVKDTLNRKMEEAGITARIKGRYKQHYSIYQKMLSQNLEFNQLYDIIAFRIILEKKSQCYEAMGLIHDMWKPIHYKFKDYIGIPKPNGYQSLHTTVIGPHGERVEIQLRTREMDEIAESGIAAHWSYKEGASIDERTGKTFAWLRDLVEHQKDFTDPDEFLENVRIDLFPDEIYVFTPEGEIKTLPKGATPVDFAYMVHSEVGDECTGAKVNGRLVPLDYKLETGNTVKIITTKHHHPSADWIHFVRTVKARTKIRQWIKAQERERAISLGREMCEKLFRKKNHNFTALLKSGEIEKVTFEDYGFKSVDDLIAHVGFGKITPLQILHKAVPDSEKNGDRERAPSLLQKLMGRRKTSRPKRGDGVVVKGLDDILVKFSKCCSPLPGDDIIGYITQGQGIKVHRKGCRHTSALSPERKIEVEWTNEESKTDTYHARLRINSTDRHGLLADMAGAINKCNANIDNASTETSDDGVVTSYFTISVKSINQLHKIMTSLQNINGVKKVRRVVANSEE
ncbi:MAG: bifunctional (p)ppGpp synthetase/guanosine-3',5'-bis(diphosphate) 3'-pyrophosphohydrolase [Desulfamplus sp.]|nr:bifunctional (p)ppGpp synthetase/guanosine-3',5'-bis(diphosphate) 3'-pyrophosphohydrolase [Desulfamplus sp.]